MGIEKFFQPLQIQMTQNKIFGIALTISMIVMMINCRFGQNPIKSPKRRMLSLLKGKGDRYPISDAKSQKPKERENEYRISSDEAALLIEKFGLKKPPPGADWFKKTYITEDITSIILLV